MMSLREISAEEVEVVPDGNLSREDMNVFQAWLTKAMRGGYRTIALSFESVASLSSTAIGKILSFKKQCDDAKRRLVMRRCSAEMIQLLKMIKFDDLIHIEE